MPDHASQYLRGEEEEEEGRQVSSRRLPVGERMGALARGMEDVRGSMRLTAQCHRSCP